MRAYPGVAGPPRRWPPGAAALLAGPLCLAVAQVVGPAAPRPSAAAEDAAAGDLGFELSLLQRSVQLSLGASSGEETGGAHAGERAVAASEASVARIHNSNGSAGIQQLLAPNASTVSLEEESESLQKHRKKVRERTSLNSAICYGLLSALSLPIAAIGGVWLSPVRHRTTARWMAFGAGALVFAVATELYGAPLYRLISMSNVSTLKWHYNEEDCDMACRNEFRYLNIQNVSGMVGAMVYVLLNRVLHHFSPQPEPDSNDGESSISEKLRMHEDSQLFGDEVVEFAPAASPAPSSEGRTASPPPRARDGGEADPVTQHPSGTATPATSECSDPKMERQTSFPILSPATPVALSMWLGALLDGIPGGIMIGFMTDQGTVTFQFLIAVFFANFPGAFSSASLLAHSNFASWKILCMWTLIFLINGFMAYVGAAIMPGGASTDMAPGSTLEIIRDDATSVAEGFTGGAMLAMVSSAMLPEAFRGAGEVSGLLFVLGFVVSVFISGIGARYGGPQEI